MGRFTDEEIEELLKGIEFVPCPDPYVTGFFPGSDVEILDLSKLDEYSKKLVSDEEINKWRELRNAKKKEGQ
jgi:hypothetical protein